MNPEIKIDPVILMSKVGKSGKPILTSSFYPSVIIWITGQIERLANDSSCHTFKNTGQELMTIFMVFEAAKSPVIIFLLRRRGRKLRQGIIREPIVNPNVFCA